MKLKVDEKTDALYSTIIVKPSEEIFSRAERLLSYNIKFKNALHLSCAIEAKADYFLTTDNQLVKKNNVISDVEIINPINFIEKIEV